MLIKVPGGKRLQYITTTVRDTFDGPIVSTKETTREVYAKHVTNVKCDKCTLPMEVEEGYVSPRSGSKAKGWTEIDLHEECADEMTMKEFRELSREVTPAVVGNNKPVSAPPAGTGGTWNNAELRAILKELGHKVKATGRLAEDMVEIGRKALDERLAATKLRESLMAGGQGQVSVDRDTTHAPLSLVQAALGVESVESVKPSSSIPASVADPFATAKAA
ncbi:hypothetical protein [Longispora urticae]